MSAILKSRNRSKRAAAKFRPTDTKDVSTIRKYVTVVWCMLECFFLAGIFYGWYSLVIVLIDEGVYQELCVNHTEYGNHTVTRLDCTARDERLALVFAITALGAVLGSIIIGVVQDRLGLRLARIVIMVTYAIGSLCMAFVSADVPWLPFIGLPLIAFAGIPLQITNVQVANMFDTAAPFVVGIMTGSFDASASVQLVVKELYLSGVSLKSSYIAISLIMVIVVSISTFLFFPKWHILKMSSVSPTNHELTSYDFIPPPPPESPSLRACLLSRIYILHVMWVSLLQLRFYFYIAAFNTWVNHVTRRNASEVDHYTNVSMYIQYGGIGAALLIGLFVSTEKRRYMEKSSPTQMVLGPLLLPLVVTSSVCVLMSGLILSHEPVAMYFVFVLLTLFRSCLYCLAYGYLQNIFPVEHLGTLIGVMTMVAGVIAMLQYPLILWIDSPPQGATKVNGVLLMVSVITYIHPLAQWRKCRNSGVTPLLK